MLRSLTGVVKGPLALLLPWLPPRLPALAAPTAAAPVSASPVSASPVSAATEERMALYQKLAAVNYCVARSAGLADSQALPLAAQTIAVILRNEHGSRIARVGDGPLPGEVDVGFGSLDAFITVRIVRIPPEVRLWEDVIGKIHVASVRERTGI